MKSNSINVVMVPDPISIDFIANGNYSIYTITYSPTNIHYVTINRILGIMRIRTPIGSFLTHGEHIVSNLSNSICIDILTNAFKYIEQAVNEGLI